MGTSIGMLANPTVDPGAVPAPVGSRSMRLESNLLRGICWVFVGASVATAVDAVLDPSDFSGFVTIAMLVGPSSIGLLLLRNLQSGRLSTATDRPIGPAVPSIVGVGPPPLMTPDGRWIPGPLVRPASDGSAPGTIPKTRGGHAVARGLVMLSAAFLLLAAVAWTGVEIYLNLIGGLDTARGFVVFEITTSAVDLGIALAVVLLFRWDVWRPQEHRTIGAYVAALGFLSIWPPPAGFLLGPGLAILGGILLLALPP